MIILFIRRQVPSTNLLHVVICSQVNICRASASPSNKLDSLPTQGKISPNILSSLLHMYFRVLRLIVSSWNKAAVPHKFLPLTMTSCIPSDGVKFTHALQRAPWVLMTSSTFRGVTHALQGAPWVLMTSSRFWRHQDQLLLSPNKSFIESELLLSHQWPLESST